MTNTTIAPSTGKLIYNSCGKTVLIISESVWTGTANDTISSTTMYMYTYILLHNMLALSSHEYILFVILAVKSLSSGEAVAIALCYSAIIVGIMIATILLLTHQLILKNKQLQVIQTPNSGHTSQEESTDMGQQTQATFHCALNDEVSSAVECYRAQWICYTNCRSLATLSVQQTMTALLSLQ